MTGIERGLHILIVCVSTLVPGLGLGSRLPAVPRGRS